MPAGPDLSKHRANYPHECVFRHGGEIDCSICHEAPPVLKRCPGCGNPTEPMTSMYGSGATVEFITRDTWCRSCLKFKIMHARMSARVGPCYCSQLPEKPHDH